MVPEWFQNGAKWYRMTNSHVPIGMNGWCHPAALVGHRLLVLHMHRAATPILKLGGDLAGGRQMAQRADPASKRMSGVAQVPAQSQHPRLVPPLQLRLVEAAEPSARPSVLKKTRQLLRTEWHFWLVPRWISGQSWP